MFNVFQCFPYILLMMNDEEVPDDICTVRYQLISSECIRRHPVSVIIPKFQHKILPLLLN